jgi:hypothetical protein
VARRRRFLEGRSVTSSQRNRDEQRRQDGVGEELYPVVRMPGCLSTPKTEALAPIAPGGGAL